MTEDMAETLALRALGWLAASDELLPVFLGSTGSSEQDLRERAADPEFLGSVLDFLLMDDDWVIDAATALGERPERLAEARLHLPGGAQVHWT